MSPDVSSYPDSTEVVVAAAVLIFAENNRFSPTKWTNKQKWLGAILWVSAASVAVLLAVIPPSDLPMPQPLLELFRHKVSPEKAMYSPLAYLLLLTIVFLLEYKMPVRDQRILSVSFWHDLSWYVARVIGFSVLLGAYVLFLDSIYNHYFEFLTINAITNWHPVAKFLVAILLADFLRYCAHFIKNKVPVFWQFHAVHHSQKDLNLFTDARTHPIDSMVSRTIRFVTLFMFQNAFPVIILWAVFDTVYPKFYHANVKLNLGPMRYILVTPQSHRVHHSRESEHRDKNFGFIFCVWDRIFGTHWIDDEVYPETGIRDLNFPHETRSGVLSILSTMFYQLIYPFTAVYRMSLNQLRGFKRLTKRYDKSGETPSALRFDSTFPALPGGRRAPGQNSPDRIRRLRLNNRCHGCNHQIQSKAAKAAVRIRLPGEENTRLKVQPDTKTIQFNQRIFLPFVSQISLRFTALYLLVTV